MVTTMLHYKAVFARWQDLNPTYWIKKHFDSPVKNIKCKEPKVLRNETFELFFNYLSSQAHVCFSKWTKNIILVEIILS